MRVFKSLLNRGVNLDTDYAVTPEGNYVHAANLTLTGDSKFFALTNIQGTQELGTILSTFSGRVLGVFANKYKIGATEDVDCLTVFTSVSNTLTIWAYDLDNNALYSLFQETYTGYDTADTQVDAVAYGENGLDRLYFTDNFNEIRKLRCEVPSPYVANFLTPEELSMQRRGTIAKLYLGLITTGGSLLCGSYQFSLRFYNEDSKTYTKWTIPSAPVNISQVTTNVGLGSYNAVSSKYIRMYLQIPQAEYDLYTHYQLAVIENTQSANGLNASLLKLESLFADSISGGFVNLYHDYKSNSRIDFVPIEDIVVDLAAIDHVKTLAIKNNRLFAGNITYTNLEYDRTPTMTGSINRVTVNNTDDYQTSSRRGLWRDEVYRYYISYFDSKYNFSRPKKLDFSSFSAGQFTANGDLKTPSKKTAAYTLLDGSSNLTNLNLSLTIDSHPTWARGFVILRAKRKARIKFQTPFIPSCLIEGIDVIGSYPTFYVEQSGTGTADKTITGTPMNPVGTHVPKNYFFPVKRDYTRVINDEDAIKLQKGEVVVADPVTSTSASKVYCTMTPDVYTTGESSLKYTYADGDKFEVADYAFLRCSFTNFGSNTYETNIGNYLDTSIHGTFYATTGGDYYYSNSVTRSDPSLPVKTGKIVGYKPVVNLGEGAQVSGNSVGQFTNLETGGVSYSPVANNQNMGFVLLDADKPDSATYGHAVFAGNQLTSASGGTVTQALYETTQGTQSNIFSASKVYGTYWSIVDIANVTTEQSDDRYGDDEDLHDMINTGAVYVFNAADQATVEASGSVPVTLDVAGGDCYTSVHQFKLTDSHYGVINVEKKGAGVQLDGIELIRRWEKVFTNRYRDTLPPGDDVIAMPVPYRNVSQVLAVVLESEILGEVLAPRVYPIVSNLQNENANEFNLRTPFPYIYNFNYSAQSNQKAFVPFDADEAITTRFKARGLFSDQKVYNTDIEGFDIFRDGSKFDLEETYGGITKLALAGDNLYAIQEKAFANLPVDAQIAETTDGSTLSLRSGTVVDIPRYISRQYGCQHMKGVVSIDSAIFFPDAFNKAVLRFEQGLELISETGMIKNFQSIFASDVTESAVLGIYDNKRRQYWIKTPDFCWVYDDRLKCWVSNYEFPNLHGGVYANNEVHLVGVDTDLSVYKMYNGSYSSLMGTLVTPRVEISLNPEFEVPKTFDDLVIYSSAALATADIVTETDSGLNQSVLGTNIAVNAREGNFRVATLRDSANARLRGLRAIITLKWPTSNAKVSLNSLITKYRVSQRMI